MEETYAEDVVDWPHCPSSGDGCPPLAPSIAAKRAEGQRSSYRFVKLSVDVQFFYFYFFPTISCLSFVELLLYSTSLCYPVSVSPTIP